MAVSATGLAHVPGQPENIAYMTMFFDGTLIAHVHANWLAPVKVRRTLLGGSRRMIVFDDLEASEKVKVYDRGISVNPSPGEHLPDARRLPRPATCGRRSSACRGAARRSAHFIECIERRRPPTTDGEAGLRVVRLLEAATQSMAQQGRPVTIGADAARMTHDRRSGRRRSGGDRSIAARPGCRTGTRWWSAWRCGHFLLGLPIQLTDSFGNMLKLSGSWSRSALRRVHAERLPAAAALGEPQARVRPVGRRLLRLVPRRARRAGARSLVVSVRRAGAGRERCSTPRSCRSGLRCSSECTRFAGTIREAFPINTFMTILILLPGGGDRRPRAPIDGGTTSWRWRCSWSRR